MWSRRVNNEILTSFCSGTYRGPLDPDSPQVEPLCSVTSSVSWVDLVGRSGKEEDGPKPVVYTVKVTVVNSDTE